jgi:hypothetical protein
MNTHNFLFDSSKIFYQDRYTYINLHDKQSFDNSRKYILTLKKKLKL